MYSVVSEYGVKRYQDMQRHKFEPHVIIEKDGTDVHTEMSKNCELLVKSFGSHMAENIVKGGLAYHIHKELTEHAGVCLQE
jgi:hypothetical protein